MSPSEAQLWINGQQRSASTKETFEVRNPQSNEVVTVSASASSQDCKDAVDAAAKAFVTWEHTPATTKRAIFNKTAELLLSDNYKAKAVRSVPEETGCAGFWVQLDLQVAARTCQEAAAKATQVKGESFPSSSVPGGQAIVHRKPHGVILAIPAWNAALALTARSIAVPLICGNTAVLKSSEVCPRSQIIIAEALHEAGLPAGVLNFISVSKENSPQLTAELIGNPHVRHINFTGSDRVGKIIAGEAAKYIKPCVLELGGKSPAIVLNDANIEDAARGIAFGSMINSGQVCISTERVIVQRGASQPLIAALRTIISKLKAGDPKTDASAQLACLFAQGSAENIVGMLKEAKNEGAEVLIGDLTNTGAVVQPHVLLGVRPGMRAWDRESFGPVVVIAVVDTVDEAVELANTSDYSLMASVWTADVYSGLVIAGRIRAGSTSVNGPTVHSEVGLGAGGMGGASGYGRFEIDDFTYKRMVVVHPPHQKYPLVG